MSKYQNALIEHINSNPSFIQPVHRKNEILGFLRQPLNDLCISRPKSRLNWGIEIPFDSGYVTYVWFDALINYITASGYLDDKNLFDNYWPANIHLIGKDILTTHAVYWPTMLMSAGIELPRSIFAHGWWLMGDAKMSKSSGNVVNPMDLIDDYGVDPVRYYLMREMVLGQDQLHSHQSNPLG
jgi:methionyl-tRNA synthetase